MNKKDAAVYKALAEIGFDMGHDIPDPKLDRAIQNIVNPEEAFLDSVEDLFLEKDTFNNLFKVKNRWISHIERGELNEIKENLHALVDNAYAPLGGHVRIKNVDDVLDPQITHWEAVDVDDNPDADAVLFGRKTPFGVKISGWGHDGQKSSKSQLMNQAVRSLNRQGYWIEASGRPADIFLSNNVPVIDDPKVLEKLYGTRVRMIDDGPFYRRVLESGKLTEKEVTFGKPNITLKI